MKQLLLIIIILTSGSKVYSAEPAPEEDYQKLEGIWSRNDQDSKGGPLRVEQELKQKISTLRVYDRNGKLIHSHQAKFQLQRMTDVNVFTYYDLQVLEGPNKGKQLKTPQSFVYRVRDAQFIQAEGLLRNDKRPLKTLIWWKKKLPEPPQDV
ncbi:hypothetical protein [Gimesia aquarii]|uniref:Lipocalin-like domain-containing protein n=1 Tax=Gimesia aquarii TaxID=2527964 RepID=A0A517VPF2_9PLAN|nr:hypothetical protein [Gimesia aquarii]QDT94901.1 hypothetical protein V144x_03340 [Gimesia aquarii]